jgi:general stress protein 26
MNGPEFNEAVAYMRSQMTCVISWLSGAGTPQSSTVFYWVNDIKDSNFSAYFITRRHTRKFEAIRNNPAVSIVIGTELAPQTMQIEGVAQLIESDDEFKHLEETIKRLESHPTQAMIYAGAFFPKSPFAGLKGTDFAVFRVVPTWARFMTLDKGSSEIVYHQTV